MSLAAKIVVANHTSVVFSSGGRRLASGGSDGTVRLWDGSAGQEYRALKGHADDVSSFSFSPDGKRLASGSDDGTVILWNVGSGQPLLTHRRSNEKVTWIGFSADGQRLVSSHAGGSEYVWDVNNARELPGKRLENWRISERRWSPDKQLFARADGNTVRLFKTSDREETGYRQAVARLDAAWHAWEAQRQEKAEQPFAAAFHLGQLLCTRPNEAALFGRLAENLEKLPETDRRDEQLALAYLGAGDIASYRCACERFLKKSSRAAVAGVALLLFRTTSLEALTSRVAATESVSELAWSRRPMACALRSDAVDLHARVLTLVTERDDPVVRGAILCRVGRHDEAQKVLANRSEPVALLYCALAEQGRGRSDAARAALAEAVRQRELLARETEGFPWQLQLEFQLLQREVAALLPPRTK